MPGWPSAPSVQTVTDKLATIAPSVGNVAGYYVWLADVATGISYGPSAKTDSGGNWSIASVPAGIYETFYGAESPTGTAPVQWQAAGVKGYLVALNPSSGLAASTAIPTGGTTLTGGPLSGPFRDGGGQVYNVLNPAVTSPYVAVADAKKLTDISISAASAVLHSPSYSFVAGDVGKAVNVCQAGALAPEGAGHWKSVEAVINSVASGDATLSVAATTAVRGPRTVTDGAMTLGQNVLTSATGAFGVDDIGKTVTVAGAGPAGATLTARILGAPYTLNSTTATLSVKAGTGVTNASTTVSGGVCGFGTDNRLAIQAAETLIESKGGGTLLFSGSFFMSTDSSQVYTLLGYNGTDICILIGSNVEFLGTPGATLMGGGRATVHGGDTTLIFERGGSGTQNNWKIRNLILDMLYIGDEANGYVIECAGGSGWRVEDCEILNFGSCAVLGRSPGGATPHGTNVAVRHCTIHDAAGGHCVQFQYFDNFRIEGLRGRSLSINGGETLVLDFVTHYVVTDLDLEANGPTNGHSSDGLWVGNRCTFTANESQGIRLDGNTNSRIAWIGNQMDATPVSSTIANIYGYFIATGCIGADCVIANNLAVLPALGANYIGLNLGDPNTATTCTKFLIIGNRAINGSAHIYGLQNSQITGNDFDGELILGSTTVASSANALGNQFANNLWADLGAFGHIINSNDNDFDNDRFSSSVSPVLNMNALRCTWRGGRITYSGAGVNANWVTENSGGDNLWDGVRFLNAFTPAQAGGSAAVRLALFAGGGSVIRNCPGFNPAGRFAPPTFPLTTVAAFNASGTDVTAWVTAGAAAITAIKKGIRPPPVNLTFTTATTGGTIAAGTQFYRVSAVYNRQAGGNTETDASAETSIVTTGSTSTVTVKWKSSPGANAYKVFGRATGAELLIAWVPGNTTSFVDDGSITPAGALPGSNGTGAVLASATIPITTTMPFPLAANEGVAFTYASGTPAWDFTNP